MVPSSGACLEETSPKNEVVVSGTLPRILGLLESAGAPNVLRSTK